LEALKIQRSFSQYKKLAASASYKECVDPAFVRVRQALLSWFKALRLIPLNLQAEPGPMEF